MSILIFIALLVALILVHELGHFAVAKFFGIRVDEFGIFFPPRIAGFKKGETLYSINALPLGGFVKIFGENAEDAANPRSFAHKNRFIQAAVIVAGIIMNLLFAWLIISVGYMVGMPTSKEHQGFGEVANPQTTIVAVLPESPAQKAGVVGGETITGIATGNESLAEPFAAADVRGFIAKHQDESLILTTRNKGEEKTFIARAAEGLVEGKKALGVELDDIGTLRLPPHIALAQGAILSYNITVATAQGLAGFFSTIFHGTANFGSVAGPIGIVGIGSGAVKEGFAAALTLTAVISINLALINLIPIPGLDGGRLLIIIVEGTLRRPVSPRIVMALTIAGFVFLIGLMLIVSYHDVLRLIG